MNRDDLLRQKLREIETEAPSTIFADELRHRVRQELHRTDPLTKTDITMTITNPTRDGTDSDERQPPKRGLALIAIAAVIAALGVFALWSRSSDDTSTDLDPVVERSTTTSTIESATSSSPTTEAPQAGADPLDVGNIWLDSIIAADREAFISIHAPEIKVNDTLIAWSAFAGGLTFDQFEAYYYDGFDALQASLETDDDIITSNGCELQGTTSVRCEFVATMIGGEETFTSWATLRVANGLITEVAFGGSNEPQELMSRMVEYLDEFGTDQDLACFEIDFNSVECGRHESDLLKRYIDFYRGDGGS